MQTLETVAPIVNYVAAYCALRYTYSYTHVFLCMSIPLLFLN